MNIRSLIPWAAKPARAESQFEMAPFNRLRQEMDEMFGRFFQDPFAIGAFTPLATDAWGPALDISETPEAVVVRAEIPGVEPKELDVSVTGDTLTLSGEKKETTEKQEKNGRWTECRYGSFRRVMTLPATVDAENVTAEYANGVVTITLKKTEKEQTKKIEVKTT